MTRIRFVGKQRGHILSLTAQGRSAWQALQTQIERNHIGGTEHKTSKLKVSHEDSHVPGL